jgi:hypothetical protein
MVTMFIIFILDHWMTAAIQLTRSAIFYVFGKSKFEYRQKSSNYPILIFIIIKYMIDDRPRFYFPRYSIFCYSCHNFNPLPAPHLRRFVSVSVKLTTKKQG